MRPRTLDIVLTAAVFVTSVSESLLSAGVSGPRWAAALLSGAMSLLLLGRRTHPVAMSVALLALVVPTAAFVVNPSDLISTFFPLLILAYGGGAYASPRGGVLVLGMMTAGVLAVGLLSPLSWWIEGVRHAVFPGGLSSIGGPDSLWLAWTGSAAPGPEVIVFALLLTGTLVTLAATGVFRASERRAKDRGLLDTTLVLVLTEFGRAPQIGRTFQNSGGPGGRDHWSNCFSVVLAGGGLPGGRAYGASDAKGAYPADRPLSPADLAATVYRLLGIDPAVTLTDIEGRRHRLCEGRPVAELL